VSGHAAAGDRVFDAEQPGHAGLQHGREYCVSTWARRQGPWTAPGPVR
jgi:hypothetical protein